MSTYGWRTLEARRSYGVERVRVVYRYEMHVSHTTGLFITTSTMFDIKVQGCDERQALFTLDDAINAVLVNLRSRGMLGAYAAKLDPGMGESIQLGGA